MQIFFLQLSDPDNKKGSPWKEEALEAWTRDCLNITLAEKSFQAWQKKFPELIEKMFFANYNPQVV